MKVLIRVLALGALAFLVGCGGGSSNTTTGAQSQCQSGYGFSTQYNQCLPQSNCPAGQGFYNNSCVATTGTTTGTTTGAACADGQINTTQYGCLARANCQLGMAFSTQTNSCVQGSQYGNCVAGDVYSTNFGCIPQAGCQANTGMSPQGCVPAMNTTTGYNTYPGQQGYPGTGGYYPGQQQQGACAQGTFNTVYGCLPQGPCQYGQVLYNNQCFYLVNQNQGGGYTNNGGGFFGFQIRL